MVRSIVIAAVEPMSGVFVVMLVEYEVVGSPVVSGRSYLEVGFHYTHYRFEIRQNSVKSTVRSEIDHFRCKIGSGW